MIVLVITELVSAIAQLVLNPDPAWMLGITRLAFSPVRLIVLESRLRSDAYS